MKLINLPPIKLQQPAYHVFIKGYRGKQIFKEPADYIVYLALMKQYVRLQQSLDIDEPISHAVKVHAYGLQPRTVQLLIRDTTSGEETTKLMRAIHISYTRYYRKKYSPHGPLFNDVYKSTIVDNNRDEQAITKSLHEVSGNHWYQDSRLFYQPGRPPGWLTPLNLVNQPK